MVTSTFRVFDPHKIVTNIRVAHAQHSPQMLSRKKKESVRRTQLLYAMCFICNYNPVKIQNLPTTK